MFDCMLDECPKNPEKCHLYWRIPWENQTTGETAIREGCILSQDMGLPIVQSMVRASHVASEHSSVARNTFENGVNRLESALYDAQKYALGTKETKTIGKGK